jgi:glycine oxidase
MADVIVIGGGVIGLTSAWELAGRGLKVTVLDRQQPGSEASWAGAGILPPAYFGPPEHPLALLSQATHPLWPQLSDELREQTGIDNGFRQCGGINFPPDGDAATLAEEIRLWERAGAMVEALDTGAVRSLEPSLSPQSGPGYLLPRTWQVRNPRHLQALLVACVRRGVEIRSDECVTEINRSGGRVTGVLTQSDCIASDSVLVTAGAWTAGLLSELGSVRSIEPIRGQMVLLWTPAPILSHVIECGPRYLVPRPDGRLLVGSTEERAGFEKRNTPAGIGGLMDFAIRMVPTLGQARFEQAWSGLRPHPTGDVPLMGSLPGIDNLYVAAGHFRAGLHLSPITARVMGQLITGEPTDVDLAPFAPAVD